MSIVLNEAAWAANAIDSRELGKKPYETLVRVAKYYAHDGLTKKEVRTKLDEFLLLCDPSASTVAWSDTLDSAVKSAWKYPLVDVDHISISDKEIARIDAIPGKQTRRLAFTLLCIAKFRHAAYGNTEYWVNTPDNEIMNMANINTSIKRQSMMYGQLRDLGMIRFSHKVDNLSVQVLFAEDGNEAIQIRDFRNLGYQYLLYHGEAYYTCQRCGLVCKCKDTAGRPNKYCRDCAAKVHMKQMINSVMRRRLCTV